MSPSGLPDIQTQTCNFSFFSELALVRARRIGKGIARTLGIGLIGGMNRIKKFPD
jgi:hypothetical protein